MPKPAPPPPPAPDRFENVGPLSPEQWEALEARAQVGGVYRIVSTTPTGPTVYVIAKPRLKT